jgi:hypothetical protein
VENAEDEGEGEGEGEEKWLAVETMKAGGELLSIVRMQREQWRIQKTKEGEGEGEEEEQWLAVLFTALFLVFFFRASVYLLCIYSSSSAPLFNVFISTICNSAQKASRSCFWLFCGVTAYGHGSHK